MDLKNHDLMMQEHPLHSLSLWRPHEIFVADEGRFSVENPGANFPESGGGISVCFQNTIRNICWRIRENTLSLFEYSLDVDIYAGNFLITFEGSKLLPGVHVAFVRNQLRIACCTLHGIHNIVLNVPNVGNSIPRPGTPQPSLLSNLIKFDFQADKSNCFFDDMNVQGDAVLWSGNTIVPQKLKRNPYLTAAILSSKGNLTLVKIMNGGPSVAHISQTSRMSRMFAGINPWADSGGPETIVGMRIVARREDAKILTVCNDKKLRIWSFSTQDLVFSYDISHHFPGIEDAKECFKIKYCSISDAMSVFADSSNCGIFLQLKFEYNPNGNISAIEEISKCATPLIIHEGISIHMVDFTYSHNILTALWRDVEENDSISICDANVGVWHDVSMSLAPVPEIPLFFHQDVRESFMDSIFFPGRFSPAAIGRTLSIHQRVPSSSLINLGISELKEKVSLHIQNEIQDMLPEDGVDDGTLHVAVWNKFYQNLVQYQQVISRSVGLTYSREFGPLITVVKEGGISVITSVSTLDSVCRGCHPGKLKEGLKTEESDSDTLVDVGKLLEKLDQVYKHLGVDFFDSIRHNIWSSGDSPRDVIGELVGDILSCGNDELVRLVGDMGDNTLAAQVLLDCLEPEDSGDLDIPDVQSWPAGTQGIELLARCTLHHLESRFRLSLLLLITLSISRSVEMPGASEGDISMLMSRSGTHVRTFKALLWVCSTTAQSFSFGTLENTLQALSLHDTSNLNPETSRSRITPSSGNKTILEYFISGEGGKLLQGLLNTWNTRHDYNLVSHSVVKAAVNIIVYLIWPLGPSLLLPDFMLNHGQFSILQRYLQGELKGWCNWCTKSRVFMLAFCHLHAGNHSKAVDSFISASSGIGSEEYLGNKLLNEDEENLHPSALEIIYYTKVLPIFERLDLPEQVVTLAEQAIQSTKASEDNSNLPILWSSIFRQSNNLARHSDALKAIVLNPDVDHKKDCLRMLTVSLCERKEYETMVEFNYSELEDDLIDILEHRARGTDLFTSQHDYYGLLYAFHIQRGNFRKAASVMYEKGYRLGREFSPSTSEYNVNCLQKQLDCFSACINCLYLVEIENRWLLHPIGNKSPVSNLSIFTSKTHDGSEVYGPPSSKVVIHELKDIERESKLVEMKIKLEELSAVSAPTSVGPLVTCSEILSFLCHAGLYDDAIELCLMFNMPLTPIFSSLASKCARLSFADDKMEEEAWEWLQENETVKTSSTGTQSSIGKRNIADVAYRLLQVYLEKYGKLPDRGSTYYYATAKALLGFSATLPAWFVSAYKLHNYPELLRLLVCFDRLEEATSLAVEMINSARIEVGSRFEIATNRRNGVCLPYTVLEQLLNVLLDTEGAQELYDNLDQSLNQYLDTAETVSDDMIQSHIHKKSVMVT